MPDRRIELPPHFIMIDDSPPPGRLGAAIKGGGAPEEISLLWQVRGSVREQVHGPLVVTPQILEGEPIPDVLFQNQVMVVSQRFRETIEPWLKDYEFILAQVELWAPEGGDYGGARVIENYWWLNNWRRLDIVDWEKTEASRYGAFHPDSAYKHSPLKATAWQNLALKHAVPDDEHFFGIAGIRGEHRYLSSALHRHLLKQNLRIKFRPKLFAWGSMPDGGPEAFDILLNSPNC